MRKPSAAQFAAGLLQNGCYQSVASDLLREDRQRRRMERAIVAWSAVEGIDFRKEMDACKVLMKIASRLKAARRRG